MNRTIWCALLILSLALLATKSYADIRPPKVVPAEKPALTIKVSSDPTKDVSFLKIPRSELKVLQASPDNKQGSWGPASSRSIVAALVASIGLASVFLLRVNRQAKIALLFLVGVITSGAVAEAWWNAPPPPRTAPGPPAANLEPAIQVIKDDFKLDGLVVIEFVDSGSLELVIGTKPVPQGNKRGPVGPRP